ncbi:MAG: hypothetical protein ACKVJR_01110 [Flavobacteriales bacterium]|tara:strand:- start:27359 stop:28615 length:1257 start_codon:yes stop_codon:yes gene_type:complete
MIKVNLSLLLFIFTSAIFAQSGSSSPYSGGGLGERNFSGTEANRHMGGLDVFTDSIHANLNNPASFGFLKLTTYSVGVNYTNNSLSSTTDSFKADTASLDYLAVSIPAGIFGFSFGILPYSSVGYKVRDLSGSDDFKISNRYEGSGGINQTYISIGIPVTKFFAVGASINYNFGKLFYRTGQFLTGIENGTFLSNQSSISGLSYLFSAQANIPIKKKYNFQGMFSFEPKAPLNSENNRVFYTQSINNQSVSDFIEVNLDAIGLDVTSVDISKTYKLGLGFGENKKWFLGLQRNLTKSATFNNDFFKRENIRYRDSKKWTIGGFYIPNYASFTSFWSRVVYRFGFRSEQMSLIVNNIPLTETGISFGVGLPLGGLSNANVGLEISQRGQKEFGLLKETLIALRIGLSLNDVWFIKRKFN